MNSTTPFVVVSDNAHSHCPHLPHLLEPEGSAKVKKSRRRSPTTTATTSSAVSSDSSSTSTATATTHKDSIPHKPVHQVSPRSQKVQVRALPAAASSCNTTPTPAPPASSFCRWDSSPMAQPKVLQDLDCSSNSCSNSSSNSSLSSLFLEARHSQQQQPESTTGNPNFNNRMTHRRSRPTATSTSAPTKTMTKQQMLDRLQSRQRLPPHQPRRRTALEILDMALTECEAS